MNKHASIALIIPAYKPYYLAETLESSANQTDINFNVYIGDDCSPFDLQSIIQPFTEILNITYFWFETNTGGNDLVAQWNRCLSMINNEKYFIMFSDDDIMESACIKKLKEAIHTFDEDIYHFDIQIINKDGAPLGLPTHYDRLLSADQFLKELIVNDLQARMPEFVFNTSRFKKCGGFVPFKNALRTDHATVLQCAFEKGIRTIKGPLVHWRDSGINTSSSIAVATANTQEDFYLTTVQFFNWVNKFWKKKEKKYY